LHAELFGPTLALTPHIPSIHSFYRTGPDIDSSVLLKGGAEGWGVEKGVEDVKGGRLSITYRKTDYNEICPLRRNRGGGDA